MPVESSQNETTPTEDDFTRKNYKPQEKAIHHDQEKMQANKGVFHQKLQTVEQSGNWKERVQSSTGPHGTRCRKQKKATASLLGVTCYLILSTTLTS